MNLRGDVFLCRERRSSPYQVAGILRDLTREDLVVKPSFITLLFICMLSLSVSRCPKCRAATTAGTRQHFPEQLRQHLTVLDLEASPEFNTMNIFPRLSPSLGPKNASWMCPSCSKSRRAFSKSWMERSVSNTSKPRQNVAPTMEQLRAPFRKKNSSTLYYTLSIILGTVAFSYGSVPMYKMVGSKDCPLNPSFLTV